MTQRRPPNPKILLKLDIPRVHQWCDWMVFPFLKERNDQTETYSQRQDPVASQNTKSKVINTRHPVPWGRVLNINSFVTGEYSAEQ